MIVRKLLHSEEATYQAIRLQALADNPEAFGSTFEEEETCAGAKFKKRLSQNPDNSILGVFDDQDEILGMLGIVRHTKVKTRHVAELWGTYVQPMYRKKGAAKLLISRSIEIVRQMGGVEQIRISVVTENAPARHLYKSLGFKPYGVEKNGFKYDNRYFDIEHMILFLQD